MSASPQAQESLSYDLLLRKACNAGAAAGPSSDDASTGEPDSSSGSSVGESSQGAAPPLSRLVLLQDVPVRGPFTNRGLLGLIRMARDLSERLFDQDCLSQVTGESGWRLALLASDDLAVLCGFIVTKVASNGHLSAYLGVPDEFIELGFGRLIMSDAMRTARLKKKQGSCGMRLSALLRSGAPMGPKFGRDEDLLEGQVSVEKKVLTRRRPLQRWVYTAWQAYKRALLRRA